MPDRVRFYPYKVTYVDLQGCNTVGVRQPLLVYTDIVRAKNSDEAKQLVRQRCAQRGGPLHQPIVVLSAGRHPERLGTAAQGVQSVQLSIQQLKVIEDAIQKNTPHPINPKAFVASKPNSTLHTRPAAPPMPPAPPVGAPRTVAKSTPIVLATDSPLDIGGFTVGFRKSGEAPVVPSPPQPFNSVEFVNTFVNTHSVLDTVTRPSGRDLSLRAYETSTTGGGFYKSSDGKTYPKAAATEVLNALEEEPVKAFAAAAGFGRSSAQTTQPAVTVKDDTVHVVFTPEPAPSFVTVTLPPEPAPVPVSYPEHVAASEGKKPLPFYCPVCAPTRKHRTEPRFLGYTALFLGTAALLAIGLAVKLCK